MRGRAVAIQIHRYAIQIGQRDVIPFHVKYSSGIIGENPSPAVEKFPGGRIWIRPFEVLKTPAGKAAFPRGEYRHPVLPFGVQ